ncbi:MAG: hypothetical protein ACKVLC_07355 [Phycisphaerales bacterium]|jgi:hypothetical protein
MKHSLIIVFFFITLPMLGMTVTSEQTQNVACTPSFLLTFLQQPDVDTPSKEGGRRYPGRMRPDRNGRQFTENNNLMPTDQVSPAMIEHCLQVVKEIDPDLAAQLSTLCEADPEALQNIIRRQGHRLGSLIRLQESDPALFDVKVSELKIDAEIYHVSTVYRALQPDDPAAQGILAELEGLIRVKTEITIQAQTLYIKRLEKHLSGLQSKLEDTTARLDEIVQTRMSQLLKVVQKDGVEVPSKGE